MPPKRSVMPRSAFEVDAVLLREAVRGLILLVPARYADHFSPDLLVELDRVLGDVAESLHARRRVAGREVELLEGLAHREDHAVAGGLGAAERAAHADRLAGDESREPLPVDRLELVEHPEHVLGARHDVGRGHVADRSHVLRELPYPAAADLLLLAHAQVVRIADDASLAAAERDVDDRALPGHPHRERPHRVDRLHRVEADAALRGAARVVVLDPESPEHLDASVVHLDRDAHVIFAQVVAQELLRRLVEAEELRDPVKLGLRHFEGVVGFVCHSSPSFLDMSSNCSPQHTARHGKCQGTQG